MSGIAGYLKEFPLLLKLCGCHPIQDRWSIQWKILYTSWRFFFFFSLLIHDILYTLGEIDLVANPFYAVEMAINISILLMLIVVNPKQTILLNLIKIFNSDFVYSTDNEIDTITMKEPMKWSRWIGIGMPVVGLFAAISKMGGVLLLKPRTLPLEITSYPYDTTKTPYFELTVLWQCITELAATVTISSTNAGLPCISVLLSQQFKILSADIKNGFYYNLIKCGVDKERVLDFKRDLAKSGSDIKYNDILMLINEAEFRQRNLGYLKKKIAHYQLLLWCSQQFNAFYNTLLVVKISNNILYMMFICFGVMSSPSTPVVLSSILYLIPGFQELFTFGLFGQMITDSSNIASDIFESPWYLCDTDYKVLFKMLLLRNMKLVKLTAGSYFVMSLETFVMFVRAIGSYVAFLISVVK